MTELQEIEKKGRIINAKFVAYMEKHRLYELFYVNNIIHYKYI